MSAVSEIAPPPTPSTLEASPATSTSTAEVAHVTFDLYYQSKEPTGVIAKIAQWLVNHSEEIRRIAYYLLMISYIVAIFAAGALGIGVVSWVLIGFCVVALPIIGNEMNYQSLNGDD